MGATAVVSTAGSALYFQYLMNSYIQKAAMAATDTFKLGGYSGVRSFGFMGKMFEVEASKMAQTVTVKMANNFSTIGRQGVTVFEQTEVTFFETGGNITGVNASTTFSQCVSRVFSMAFGIAMQWVMAVSLAVMIISLLVELIYPLIEKDYDEPYIDIPRVMCSYEEVFGQTKIENTPIVEDYIYYYGLKNPFLTENDDKRANTRDGKLHQDIKEGNVQKDQKDTNILKYGIGDVANWTLKGRSRQWVAVYYTTDSKAGKPILAESLTVLNGSDGFSQDNELIPVIKFHENAPYDFNQAYAVTQNEDLTGVFLGYKFDNNAGTTTQTASVFSDITLWGGVIAGLILGGGIGTLVTYGIIRKRKKKMA